MADKADVTTGPAAAADRIRESAKWLTVSLASIGTLLLAGTQLSGLGKLDTGSSRFHDAIVALVVTAAATGVILVTTAWVAATPAQSLTSLARTRWYTPRGVRKIRDDVSFLGGTSSITDLHDKYVAAIKAQDAAYQAVVDVSEISPQQKADIDKANKLATGYSGVVNGLLVSVGYARVAFRWRVAVWVLVLCGATAGGGIAWFAWAANPPAAASGPAATAAVVSAGKPVTVQLTAAGRSALAGSLSGCNPAQPLTGYRIGSTDSGLDVLITGQGGSSCGPTRFVAIASWATVTG